MRTLFVALLSLALAAPIGAATPPRVLDRQLRATRQAFAASL